MNEEVKKILKDKEVNLDRFPERSEQADFKQALIHDKAVMELEARKIVEGTAYEGVLKND